EPEDGEPQVRFRLLCPARLRRLWSEVVELARRMAGSDLSQSEAAEAIAAEGLSARPADGEAWPATWQPPDRPPAPDETLAGFPPCLDWAAVTEAIPDAVDRLADDADALDAFALDARLRAAIRARQRIDWQMGRLLRIFLDRRLYLAMQFPSAAR